MSNNNTKQAFKELCLVSRSGVCILDMQQVLDAARELNLVTLAQIVSADIEAQKFTTGDYYQLVAKAHGVA
jgi:hypothetical protein